jgi:exodeoxyribonuclease VII small subunit
LALAVFAAVLSHSLAVVNEIRPERRVQHRAKIRRGVVAVIEFLDAADVRLESLQNPQREWLVTLRVAVQIRGHHADRQIALGVALDRTKHQAQKKRPQAERRGECKPHCEQLLPQLYTDFPKLKRQLPFDCELDERHSFHYFSAVPNQSKGAGQQNPAKNPQFEEALKKLEGVVEAMESDDLPLETLLAKYEEGAKLVKICQEKLAEAELKIQQLEKNAAGELKLKPFEKDVES